MFVFEGQARIPLDATISSYMGKDQKIVAVWTDGVAFSSDNLPDCAFPLEVGKTYRITVEEIKED